MHFCPYLTALKIDAQHAVLCVSRHAVHVTPLHPTHESRRQQSTLASSRQIVHCSPWQPMQCESSQKGGGGLGGGGGGDGDADGGGGGGGGVAGGSGGSEHASQPEHQAERKSKQVQPVQEPRPGSNQQQTGRMTRVRDKTQGWVAARWTGGGRWQVQVGTVTPVGTVGSS